MEKDIVQYKLKDYKCVYDNLEEEEGKPENAAEVPNPLIDKLLKQDMRVIFG